MCHIKLNLKDQGFLFGEFLRGISELILQVCLLGFKLIFIPVVLLENRDEKMFDTTIKILKDINKLVNVNEWNFGFYGSNNTITINMESIK